MTRHLERDAIEQYIERKVPSPELLEIDAHLAECEECGTELDELLQRHPSPNAFSILDLDDSGADEHPGYDLLADFVDGRSDEVDREIVEVHSESCRSCSEQIAELRVLRAQINSAETWEQPSATWSSWLRILVPAAAIVLFGVFAWIIFVPREPDLDTADLTVPIEELPRPADIGGPPNTNESNAVEPAIIDPIYDSGRAIGLNENGELVGIDVPRALNDKLTGVLKGGTIEVPAAAKGLATQRGVLMGDGDGVTFSLRSPVGKAIESDRPVFRWEQLSGAETYEVDVVDENFNRVASSGKIDSATWTSSPLPRGRIYHWQVTATKDGVEIRSPVRPAPDARFLVISSDAAGGINKARALRPRSKLLLGIAYAEAGMIEEARAEFNALAKKNPRSPVPQRLLNSLR